MVLIAITVLSFALFAGLVVLEAIEKVKRDINAWDTGPSMEFILADLARLEQLR